MRQKIPKAAMRASNNAIRGYIPHTAIVSQGAKIAARQQGQETGKAYRDKHRKRKTRFKAECGRCTGCEEII